MSAMGGLRTFAQRRGFGQSGDIGGMVAIAKEAELREPAMSLSKTANPPQNVDEVRLGEHHTLHNVK
jgi:hypothetical protein